MSSATTTVLGDFIAQAVERSRAHPAPADCVLELAPLMLDLLGSAETFLEPKHYRSTPAGYTRNLVYALPDRSLSLYSLVWLPGQWTPVHDHGCWGVVGVVQGLLEERAYMSATGDIAADSGIRLKRGGVILLSPGSVSSFVPNPDHIHRTGVAAGRETCVSLHLYGRNMNSFHVYDVDAGTRRMIDVPQHASR
jgi:predicted metal-dependent enzyme (double-stranded beta helix superfamily)